MMNDQAQMLRRLISQAASARQREARLIAVAGGKGGVGTTTIAFLLAESLTLAGERVVLIDANPVGGHVAACCGIVPSASVTDVWHKQIPVRDVLQPGPHGMLVLPATWTERPDTPISAEKASRFLGELCDLDSLSDWMVVDVGCQANARSWHELLSAADEICMVTRPDPASVMDAYATIKHCTRYEIRRPITVIVNHARNISQATDVHCRMTRSCRRFLGIDLLWAGWIAADPHLDSLDQTSRLASDNPTVMALRVIAKDMQRRLQATTAASDQSTTHDDDAPVEECD